MKRNMKWLLLALALVAMIALGGCAKEQPVNGGAPAVATMAPTATVETVPETTVEAAAQATEAPAATDDAAAATAVPTAAPTADPNAVIATVNGQDVLRKDFDVIAENLAYSYAQYGYDTTDPSFLATMNQYALDYAVQTVLMEQKAVELGLDKFTDEEKAAIEKENADSWNETVEMYVSYYGGLTEESTEEEKAAARVNILAMLEGMGYTEAVMLESMMENAVLDKVEATMIEGTTVTDEEVKTLFDQYVQQDENTYKTDVAMYEYMTQYYGQPSYYVPEGYRGVTHILLEVDEELLGNYQSLAAKLEEQQEAEETPETVEPAADATATPTADPAVTPEAPVTQAEVDAAYAAIIASVQPTIDEINKKLEEGTAFADLIVEYGKDPGMEQEPAKTEGYSVHMDSVIWDPAFVQAAFSVDKVGDIAAPVVGSYGVHIVQYTRDVPAGAVEYTADVQLALHEEALSQKENEKFSEVMQQWLAESKVEYTAEGQSLMADAAE